MKRSHFGYHRAVRRCALPACAFGSILLLGLADPAMPADKANLIATGAQVREDRTGDSLTYMHAFSGSLRKDGALVRLGYSAGGYDDDDGNYSGEVLAGWQSYVDGWRLRGFAGLLYRGEVDPGEGHVGFKGIVQATTKWSAPTYVDATASYDSSADRVSARLQIGRHVSRVIAGPDAAITWTEVSERYQVGLFVTGVKVGDVGLSFRGGYTHSGTGDSRDSPYLGASANYQF